jgi:phosphinothricin acetyltransferase
MFCVKVENVTIEDAEELLAIYAYYIRETAVSFEYDVPTIGTFEKRIAEITAKYPYLKAVNEDGVILGYAYANTFKDRAAYDWSVETTIYVRNDLRRAGIGRKLYSALAVLLQNMGILNLNACIAVTSQEDPHLTNDSVSFHEKMGFQLVGTFHNSGYKFNTWYDMIWMEKLIGKHCTAQNPVSFGRCDWKSGAEHHIRPKG